MTGTWLIFSLILTLLAVFSRSVRSNLLLSLSFGMIALSLFPVPEWQQVLIFDALAVLIVLGCTVFRRGSRRNERRIAWKKRG